MICHNCRQSLPANSNFCSKCGSRPISPKRRIYNEISKVVFASAIPVACWIFLAVRHSAQSEVAEPTRQHTASTIDESRKLERSPVEPELQMSELMLQPKSKIELKIGHPLRPAIECMDTNGQQYEYADTSYLCTEHGRVNLFSYRLRKPVSTADAALQAVGLHTDIPPFALGKVAYIWSDQYHNQMLVGKTYAKQVTVMIGVPPHTVEVDMD